MQKIKLEIINPQDQKINKQQQKKGRAQKRNEREICEQGEERRLTIRIKEAGSVSCVAQARRNHRERSERIKLGEWVGRLRAR